MQRISRRLAVLGLMLGLALSVSAVQAALPAFRLTGFGHQASGGSQVFTIEAKNDSSRDMTLHGRVIAVSVYDTSKPAVLTFVDQDVPAGASKSFSTLWPQAPFLGRVHALLVLSDDAGESTVAASDFWVLPFPRWTPLALAAILGLLLLILLVRALVLRQRNHVPAHTVAYRTEGDDTVVSIANRYGVTWQDIVKANGLKAPYDLKPGMRLFVPKHSLQHPPEPGQKQPTAPPR